MTIKTATKAMRRKAGAGRPAPEVGRMTTTRSWKLSMPKAADETLGVQASVLRVDENREVRDNLGGLVVENALIVLLEGPEERFGVAVVSPPILSGFIEAATTGRIASRPVMPRVPTRTDATIVADLLDAVLERFETNLAEMEDPPNLSGYRFAAPLSDSRGMILTLGDGPYSVYRLTLDLGGGVRQGEVAIAFPVAPRGAASQDAAVFQQALAENVMSAPSELDAVLHRVQMPLSEVSKLRSGDILRVPLAALATVDLAAIGGANLAHARLGQQGGFRAVRITCIGGEAAELPPGLEFHEAAPAPPRYAATGGAECDVDVAADLPGLSVVEHEDDLPDIGALQADESADALPDISEDVDPPEIEGLPPLSG